jgi:hypothetical protein
VAEEFTGFANAVNAKGKTVDASKVKPFQDESEAGKIRTASQTTPSSIVDFRTEGPSTNGAPMAVVAPTTPEPDVDEADASTADAAEGEGANGS